MNKCGSCTACCTALPVNKLGKGAFVPCLFLRKPLEFFMTPVAGCSIYERRPRECRAWQCAWLKDGLDPELRPDRLGIVIDTLIDVIDVNGQRLPAAQFWVMPGREAMIDDERVRRLVMATIFAPENAGIRAVLFRTAGDRAISMSRHPTDDNDPHIYVSPTVRMSAKAMGGAAERFAEAQRMLGEKHDARPAGSEPIATGGTKPP